MVLISDQAVQMGRLVCIYAVCSHKKQVFAQRGYNVNQRETELVYEEKHLHFS